MSSESTTLTPKSQPAFLDPIPGVFPHGSVNVVSGASGAGKTILMAIMLAHIRAGIPTWGGRPTNPQAGYGIIVADRDWATYATIYNRIGFPDIPRYVLVNDKEFDPRDWGKKQNALTLFERCLRLLAPAPGSLIYVDAVAPLFIAGDQNNARDVALSLLWFRQLAERFQITFILFANVAKQKTEDTYRRAQDRIAGSGAFVAYSDTQISVEQDPEGIVSLQWTPRLEAQATFQFKFNPQTGLFAPYESAREPDQKIGDVTLPAHLARIYGLIPDNAAGIVSPEIIKEADKQFQLKRTVVFKHLQKLNELGLIERDSLGVVRRKSSTSVAPSASE